MFSSFRPRVCAVSYLNTAPLIWGLQHGEQQGCCDLTFALPSACADALAQENVDVGLIPVAELLRLPVERIADVGIASYGPVRSILLVSRVPLQQIQSVALDTSSRTSVALLRVLLKYYYCLSPTLARQAPDLNAMLAQHDAALLIGDPALRIEIDKLPFYTFDLGQEWSTWTGLPMVYAAWCGPSHRNTKALREALHASFEFGWRHLDEIARTEGLWRGFPMDATKTYLTEQIRYPIGHAEQQGLRRFLELAGSLPNLAERSVATYDVAL